jgi:hypothetical protein
MKGFTFAASGASAGGMGTSYATLLDPVQDANTRTTKS